MKILFFASLREQLDCDSEQWTDLEGVRNAGDVKAILESRGEPWSSALANKRIVVSINQEIADLSSSVSPGDELAFYPPVTGG
jgi:molybdopterin synthase sulfur carrier subunit